MRIELIHVGLLVYLANHYTTWGARLAERCLRYILYLTFRAQMVGISLGFFVFNGISTFVGYLMPKQSF